MLIFYGRFWGTRQGEVLASQTRATLSATRECYPEIHVKVSYFMARVTVVAEGADGGGKVLITASVVSHMN